MASSREALLEDVYSCARCDARTFGFEPAGPGAGYYKFPATIGAGGPALVLFVGINPRRSSTNAVLHRDVMRSLDAFTTLAANRIPDASGRPTRPYIEAHATERHYALHTEIVQSVFGAGQRLEDHAAVTELLLCATVAAPVGDLTSSPCASRFLARTIDQVRPEVIIGIGAAVDTYFRSRAPTRTNLTFRADIAGHHPWFIPVPHPNARGLDSQTRRLANQTAARWTRDILDAGAPSSRPPFTGALADVWKSLQRPSTAGQAPAPRAALAKRPNATGDARLPRQADALAEQWRRILLPRPTSQTGRTLAAHPDATALTQRLVSNLTLERLILLANVAHNKCRPSQLAELSPTDRTRDPQHAWQLLEHGMANTQMRENTAWTRTIHLLRPGSTAGLAAARALPVDALIGLCERIITGPYQAAR